MVPKEQVHAVCDGILPTFPGADSDPPMVPEHYFDSGPDVAIIRSEHYSLGISEECFSNHEAWMVAGSLVSMDYARLLREHKRLLSDVCPGALVRTCPVRQRWGIGTCSSGQTRTPPTSKLAL